MATAKGRRRRREALGYRCVGSGHVLSRAGVETDLTGAAERNSVSATDSKFIFRSFPAAMDWCARDAFHPARAWSKGWNPFPRQKLETRAAAGCPNIGPAATKVAERVGTGRQQGRTVAVCPRGQPTTRAEPRRLSHLLLPSGCPRAPPLASFKT
jgi:hypothetical protein